MERVEQIKEKVEALVNEAIAILEKNYDLNMSSTFMSAPYMSVMDLNSALMEIDCLDDECLKIED